MSKFMLSAALVLGSLVGGSAVVQGGERSQSTQTEAAQSVQTVAAPTATPAGATDYGEFSRFTDAIPTRNFWRKKGYAANIVDSQNGGYTVRVFNK